MKITKLSIFALLSLFITACTTPKNNDLTKDLTTLSIVEENHAVITENMEKYTLNTYIKLFSRPYFIHIVKQNRTEINEATALKIVKNYIQSRGCTAPIENEQIIKKSVDKSQLIIRLEC
ncbi:hypothetical protein L5B71_03255 [Avibacterium sp. 21-586]|uniref:hypothetical protein n=1 Tax=Avibacterium sp. 21-586 TaxID=2911534 RepID=UPI002246A9C3|nr:hypothetical protein [Avibacterium sp. 21-586]MCW9709909.1 hypothetical protein [Avibacterium sp. 21-586]